MKQLLFILFCGLIMSHSNGFAQNKLKTCPTSPNCVSSQASDSHAIEPFLLIVSSEEGWQKIVSALSTMERVKIIHTDNKTAHAEATSLILRFVDDIDFVFNKEERRVDIRSSSRIGYSDFGTNRDRLEKLRNHLQKAKVIQ